MNISKKFLFIFVIAFISLSSQIFAQTYNNYGDVSEWNIGTAYDYSILNNYGNATNIKINSGGTEKISCDGTQCGSSYYNTVNSGGIQVVNSGGVSTGTVINSGGVQDINAGASSYETIIHSGGIQNVNDGGEVTSVTIDNGGTQIVTNNGSAISVSNAGSVKLYFGGRINNYTNTANTGVLGIYGTATLVETTNIANGKLEFYHSDISHPDSYTLTVSNLLANNAAVSMGVNLQNQTADKIIINNVYNGTAVLSLSNMATTANPTTGNGIQLVQFVSNHHGSGTFSLDGGQWDQGGYIYKLFDDEAGYYLRSIGEYTDTFKTILNVPALTVAMAKAGMDSLNKRMGALRDMNNPQHKNGLWVKSYYKSLTVDDLLKTDMSLFGVEAGYDWLFNPSDLTKVYFGIMGGYMQADSIKTKDSNGDSNDGDGYAPSAGVYLTVANDNSWFVDLVARHFWTKIDSTTRTASNTLLEFKPKRNILAASIEAGKTITYESAFKVEPKIQIIYAKASDDTTKVTNGIGNLEYDSAKYLLGKAAIMFSYEADMGNNLLIEPLLELAYNREFKGRGLVRYGDAEKMSSLKGGSFEIDAGFSMQITDDIYWHALGTYEKGSKLSGWGINAGIRFSFGGNSSKQRFTYADKKKKLTYAEKKGIKRNIRPANYNTPDPENGRYHMSERYKTFH